MQEATMSEHVYKTIELTGSSTKSIEAAIEGAIAKASKSVRKMQWFQVMETRGHIVEGKIGHYQVTLKVGFTLED
jgi:dodecin